MIFYLVAGAKWADRRMAPPEITFKANLYWCFDYIINFVVTLFLQRQRSRDIPNRGFFTLYAYTVTIGRKRRITSVVVYDASLFYVSRQNRKKTTDKKSTLFYGKNSFKIYSWKTFTNVFFLIFSKINSLKKIVW